MFGKRDGFLMILMPLVMLLPLAGLAVFWILPLSQAAPIYLILVSLFTAMMWVMRRTMKYPRKTGVESLPGRTAEVVSETGGGYGPRYLIRILGELWSADSEDVLHAGETVVIVAVRGNHLLVKRKNGNRGFAD